MKTIRFLVAALFILALGSCKKETEEPQYPTVRDYYPLTVGSTFLYRLDSTVLCPFNACLRTTSYQVLDSVESTFSDATGKTSFRIFRYLRDTAGTTAWVFNNTFFATLTDNQIEYVEDNNRFIRLHNPVKNDFQWPGNTYIQTNTANTFLYGWNYLYQSANAPFTTRGITYDSTITILQRDEFSPEGPEDLTLPIQQRDYSVEVFAKGIGLVHKDFIHWIWQRPTNPDGSLGTGSYLDDAYGVRLSLIAHK